MMMKVGPVCCHGACEDTGSAGSCLPLLVVGVAGVCSSEKGHRTTLACCRSETDMLTKKTTSDVAYPITCRT
ncbi:hypothetical protein ACLOJK_003993 [Asimina triloba]